MTLDAVSQDRLSTLGEELKSSLNELSCQPLDLETIQDVIKQQIIGLEKIRETAPDTYVQQAVLQGLSRELACRRFRRSTDFLFIRQISYTAKREVGALQTTSTISRC